MRFRDDDAKSPEEPSPVLPVAPSVAALDVVANNRHQKQQQQRETFEEKSAFLDDIAGGEGEDDDANEQDYDSDDARFIDDESQRWR